MTDYIEADNETDLLTDEWHKQIPPMMQNEIETAVKIGTLPIEIARDYIDHLNKVGVISDEVRDHAFKAMDNAERVQPAQPGATTQAA